mmetsp:Transcript_14279/g.35618  ORF Transcript_14279/g.35618 Transcript_14279/m.35618 type:complete len:239 (+) Transcript_14279:208-924(+)
MYGTGTRRDGEAAAGKRSARSKSEMSDGCRLKVMLIFRDPYGCEQSAPTPCCPPPKAIGYLPRTPTGCFGSEDAAAATTSGWTSLHPFVGMPRALSTMTSAASFPASTAPSIEPKNFCEVKSPARTKLLTGVSCEGRYLLRPGVAAYTERGTRTTACLTSLACPRGPCAAVAGHVGSRAISWGKRRASSPMAASTISSSDLAIQLTSLPASGEQGAKTSSSIEASSEAYSAQQTDISA